MVFQEKVSLGTRSSGEGELTESRTQENYIKAIYELSQRGVGEIEFHRKKKRVMIYPQALAEKLSVNVSAVYLMMKKLTQQEWIRFQPYKGISLTKGGESLAVQLLRRHRLWESFLQMKLGFDWSEVHALAEELEHIGNEGFISRLEKFLGFPTEDPHGDPIPDREGHIDMGQRKQVCLADLEVGERGEVSRVLISSEEFFHYLKEIELDLGSMVVMEGQSGFDASYKVKIEPVAGKGDGVEKSIYLSKRVAKSLLVAIAKE